MSKATHFFDDITRLAGGAGQLISGLKSEMEQMVRQKLERALTNMNLVERTEFEVMKKVATEARREQKKLEKRVEALEKALSLKGTALKTTAKKKTASKKTIAKKTNKTSVSRKKT